jgi:hypothetical protein
MSSLKWSREGILFGSKVSFDILWYSLVYFKDLPTICEKDFNSLSQKRGIGIELAAKPKDGMANRLLVSS